jgi:ribosomal protein S18 acetylase RimI-like enzyme
MRDRPIEARRGAYLLTTDRRRIAPADALALLAREHWAGELRPETFARAMENSVCFGILDGERLVAFGRAVTDLATYAYWTDVVVDEAHRGQGLGRWLAASMLAHPELQDLRRVALLTRDARALYERLGFTTDLGARTYMERRP